MGEEETTLACFRVLEKGERLLQMEKGFRGGLALSEGGLGVPPTPELLTYPSGIEVWCGLA